MPLSAYMIDLQQRKLGIRPPIEKKKPKPIAKISEKKKAEIAHNKETILLDKEFYLEVWHASSPICQCGCKKKLPREMQTIFMHHLLEKAQFPGLRHVHENIMILAPECHNAYHDNPNNRPEIVRRRKIAMKLLLKK